MPDGIQPQPDAARPAEQSRAVRLSSSLFLNIEHTLYIVLGLVLSVVAVGAMLSAIISAGSGLASMGAGDMLLVSVDHLLFVLMLAEILHTVRVSIRSGTLDCEPFLIVGLIASIRRVLVITLESSQSTQNNPSSPPNEAVFRASMIELGVLAGLILVMVISIALLRRYASHARPDAKGA